MFNKLQMQIGRWKITDVVCWDNAAHSTQWIYTVRLESEDGESKISLRIKGREFAENLRRHKDDFHSTQLILRGED